MTLSSAQSWLKSASWIVGLFGLATALGAHPATSAFTTYFIDLVFWPIDGGEPTTAPAARLAVGILGGVLVGWAVMLWWIAARWLPQDPVAARQAIMTGFMAWFIIDGCASAAAGAPLNILMNVPFLALFLWPLRAPLDATTSTA